MKKLIEFYKKKFSGAANATPGRKRDRLFLLLAAVVLPVPLFVLAYAAAGCIKSYHELFTLLVLFGLISWLDKLAGVSMNYGWKCRNCKGCPEKDIQKLMFLTFRRCAEPLGLAAPTTVDAIKAVPLSSQFMMPGYWYRVVKKREVRDRLELPAVKECLSQTIDIIFQTQTQNFGDNIRGIYIFDIIEDAFSYTVHVIPKCSYTQKYIQASMEKAAADYNAVEAPENPEVFDDVF